MNLIRTTVLAIAAALAAPISALAGEWDLTGNAGLSSRAFPDDSSFARQHSGSNLSLHVQPEVYWQGSNNRARFSAVVFGRRDSEDDERSHVDLREASFGVTGNGWDVNVGVNKVFWGVTEARHLVDVINQTDLVEDIDEEDKLGQPMLNVNIDRDFGRIEVYLLPRFRERSFPGPDGRLRAPLAVDTDAAVFESRDGKSHRDVALRYSHYFGDFDFGAYIFDGTSREPRFELSVDGSRLIPVYEQMQQFGVDVQLTRDAWLWKFEAISRDTASDSFVAAAAGFEYTLFGINQTAADVGILVEYLYDARNSIAPPTAFDNDIFLGARLALNDVGDTSLLAGTVFDTSTRETFFNVEASRRIGQRLTIDGRLRVFGNSRPGDATHSFSSDDYLEISASWYF